MKHFLVYLFIMILLFGIIFPFCKRDDSQLKIIYINSYHKGHPSSDEIMQGFMDNIPTDSFQVYSWYMDTKRNPTEEFIRKKALDLLDSIKLIKPDILVVSDDNAVKYIVAPNLNQLNMPVVFCGVNWTDKDYDLPKNQVTGIIEILPVADAIQILQLYYPSAKKLLVLNENTTTSRKEVEILDTLFQDFGLSATFKLVDNFQEWKTAFTDGNKEFDIIYVSTHAAIKDWNKNEAEEFIGINIKVPVFTCEDFMMPYAVLGVTKVAEEHGIWAAKTAKKILSGSAPADFPVTRNQLSNTWINKKLAEIIGFSPDSVFLKNAVISN
jgi:ABC-type uncharacterized transport system substrate-binding protein